MSLQIETILLKDDGIVPNNERLPLVLYRSALPDLPAVRPELSFEQLFEKNGWRGAWVNGIYPFHHYHACAHEVLGIAAGSVRVQFGGASGPVIALAKGDAVVIPAGVGHCRRSGPEGLVVVGAYPKGQENWDLKRATAADREQALEEIPRVPIPPLDPVAGPNQGLPLIWS
jgi:uncharacterized protein YjlB